MDNTLSLVQDIFRDILDDDHLVISLTDTPKEILNWDSFANVSIIVAVESEFGIKFGLEGIQSVTSVNDIVTFIENNR